MGGMPRRFVLALLLVLLAGCQLRVATDVLVERDGGGQVELTLVVDDELRDLLREAGEDPAAGLGSGAQGAAWTVEVVEEPDATGVRLSTSFAEPAGLGDAVDALLSGLEPDDGAVLRDVRLSRDAEGGYRLALRAGIEPPAVVGTAPEDPSAPRFDGDDLARLLAERGAEVARADLRVTFPTSPTVEVGSGTIEGTTVTVALPNDRLAEVVVTAPPPSGLPLRETAAAAAVAAGLGLVVVTLLRRRR